MTEKAYISNIIPGLSIEDQQAKLAGIDRVYVDKLGPKAQRERLPAALKDRARLLAPTARQSPETIIVVDLHVLAWSTKDLCDVIAAAAARHATIRELSTGLVIEPSDGVAALAQRLPAFAEFTRTRGWRKSRAERAAEREEEHRQRALAVAHLYQLPDAEMPLDRVREAAGLAGKPMAPATLRKHLGIRKDAQRKYAAGLKRSATAAAKKGTPDV